jgi:hypothetical protein
MTPEERLKQKVKNLIHKTGCSPEDAIAQISQDFGSSADQADMLQNIKHQVEWDLKFGK